MAPTEEDQAIDAAWRQFVELEGEWIHRIEAASFMSSGKAREKDLLDGCQHFLARARKMEPTSTERRVYIEMVKMATELLIDGYKPEEDRRRVYLGDVSGREG